LAPELQIAAKKKAKANAFIFTKDDIIGVATPHLRQTVGAVLIQALYISLWGVTNASMLITVAYISEKSRSLVARLALSFPPRRREECVPSGVVSAYEVAMQRPSRRLKGRLGAWPAQVIGL
jgi:hypothetical protein